MILACVGFGLISMWILGAERFLQSALERLMSGFIVGIGLFGWLLFFPGILGLFTPTLFWGVMVVGVAAFLYRMSALKGIAALPSLSGIDLLLCAILAVAAGFDLLEAIAPAADADTLAYHFALPRDFVSEGQISFVPRAVSGAIPLLLHLTYAVALATGGELTLTLWTAATGWAPGLLLYALVRRELTRTWSLVLLAIFITTPAVLYGGGSGHTEIRCAGFALASIAFLLTSEREASYRVLALAGACAGFFIASKYYGLIFGGATGLAIIFFRDSSKRCLVFGAAALIAGSQWYLWNYFHTGDPVFPIITNLMQFPESSYWNSQFGTYFAEALAISELPLERSLTNWALYLVYSTFNIVERLEGGRTGLGIALILVLPAVAIGIMNSNERRREILIPLVVASIFFTVWFFSGTTQRTRHLLPVYPLILLTVYPMAVRFTQQMRLERAMIAGLGATLIIQLTGHTIYTTNYAHFALTSETRAQFLERNVPGSNVAHWANDNLRKNIKLGFMNRQLAYLLKIPAFMIHPHMQVVVDARPNSSDQRKFVAQIKRQGLTHLLLTGNWQKPIDPPIRTVPFFNMIASLVENSCLKGVKVFDTIHMPSRTLSNFGGAVHQSQEWIFQIDYPNCP